MPAFELDPSTFVDWKNPNDPAVWTITLDGIPHKFLLDPDPSVEGATDVDIEDDGWISVVASNVFETIPARYAEGGYEGRAAFDAVMEQFVQQNDFLASHLGAMVRYVQEQREAAQKSALGKNLGGRTRRR